MSLLRCLNSSPWNILLTLLLGQISCQNARATPSSSSGSSSALCSVFHCWCHHWIWSTRASSCFRRGFQWGTWHTPSWWIIIKFNDLIFLKNRAVTITILLLQTQHFLQMQQLRLATPLIVQVKMPNFLKCSNWVLHYRYLSKVSYYFPAHLTCNSHPVRFSFIQLLADIFLISLALS